MKKTIRLTESDLTRIVERVINEQSMKNVLGAVGDVIKQNQSQFQYSSLRPCKTGEKGELTSQGTLFALTNAVPQKPFCKIVSSQTTGGGSTPPVKPPVGGGSTPPVKPPVGGGSRQVAGGGARQVVGGGARPPVKPN
jgi:hypothetical protein